MARCSFPNETPRSIQGIPLSPNTIQAGKCLYCHLNNIRLEAQTECETKIIPKNILLGTTNKLGFAMFAAPRQHEILIQTHPVVDFTRDNIYIRAFNSRLRKDFPKNQFLQYLLENLPEKVTIKSTRKASATAFLPESKLIEIKQNPETIELEFSNLLDNIPILGAFDESNLIRDANLNSDIFHSIFDPVIAEFQTESPNTTSSEENKKAAKWKTPWREIAAEIADEIQSTCFQKTRVDQILRQEKYDSPEQSFGERTIKKKKKDTIIDLKTTFPQLFESQEDESVDESV